MDKAEFIKNILTDLVIVMLDCRSMDDFICRLEFDGESCVKDVNYILSNYNSDLMEAFHKLVSLDYSESKNIEISQKLIEDYENSKNADKVNSMKTLVRASIVNDKKFHAYILCLCFLYDYFQLTPKRSSSVSFTVKGKRLKEIFYSKECKQIDSSILNKRYNEIMSAYVDYIIILMLDLKREEVNKYFSSNHGETFKDNIGFYYELYIYNDEKYIKAKNIYEELYLTSFDGLVDKADLNALNADEFKYEFKNQHYFFMNRICSIFYKWVFYYNETALTNAVVEGKSFNLIKMTDDIMKKEDHYKVFKNFMQLFSTEKDSLYSLFLLNRHTNLFNAHLAALSFDNEYSIDENIADLYDYYCSLVKNVSNFIPFTVLIVLIKSGYGFINLQNDYLPYFNMHTKLIADELHKKLAYNETLEHENYAKIIKDLDLYFILANASKSDVYYNMIKNNIKKHNKLNNEVLMRYFKK